VLMFILFFIFNIQPARANMKSLDAIKILNSNPPMALATVEDALYFQSPHMDDIRSDISRSAVQVASSLMQNPQVKTDFLKKILDVCYTELDKNVELHPLDIRNHMTLSQMSQIMAQLNNDPKKMSEAEGYLKLALEKSPRRQQLIFSLSMIQMQTGKFSEAIKLLEGAMADNPKIGESYWRLAYVYKISGNNQKALQILQLAQTNGVTFTESENNIIAQIMAIPSTSPITTVKKK
jgi:predicted Zn-dependent protease